MTKILKTSVSVLVIFAVVMSADYVYRFLRGEEEKSFLAYILSNGEYLLNLVNKQNSLEKYTPADLVDLAQLGAKGKQIRRLAYDSLTQLINAAKSDNVNLRILSAYRSYEKQKSLFSFYSRFFKNASRFSAEAGHSEHQLGTAIDFGSGNSRTDLTAKFAETAQGKWLLSRAWQYGFILSYPEGKEVATGYIYEPWHYRFVGIQTAKECHDLGLFSYECLSRKPQYYYEK